VTRASYVGATVPFAVAAVAFLVRLVYLAQLRHSPFAQHPLVDADTYDRWAQTLAGGDWLGHEVYWQAPLYPYLLGVIYAIAGHSYTVVRVVQALLSAGTTALLYAVGLRTVGRTAALVASCAFALYGTAVYYDGQLLSTSLILFLETLLLLLVIRARETPAVARWVAAGFVLGLCILARPEIALLGVGVALWTAFSRVLRWPVGARVRALGAFAAAALVVSSTAMVRNYAVERDLVPISYNGGVNFFIGNNPDYDRTVAIRPFFEWRRLAREPLKAGAERPSEQSAWYFKKSFGWIARHPSHEIGLLLRKAAATWRGVEKLRNEDLYAARRYSWLLSALMWVRGIAVPFGVVAPLAALGAVVGRRREGPLLFLAIGSTVATCVIFFVAARYRLPMIPALLLLAAQGAEWLWHAGRALDTRRLAGGLGAVCAIGLLVNVGQGPASPPDAVAETELSLASIADQEGRHDEAITYFRNALAIKHPYPEAEYGMAVAFLATGRPDSARVHAASAARGAPDIEDTYHVLAVAEDALGDYRTAAATARRALVLNPSYVEARAVLAVALAQQGDRSGALAEADTVAAAPAIPPAAAEQVARVFATLGEPARALRLLDHALSGNPHADLQELRDAIASQTTVGSERPHGVR
jgi:4-amino-4-deoxy-L-arabinose transferase-like glycosyltransferase